MTGLVTDSGLPDTHFIREAGIARLAFDALLGHDSRSVENAVAWSRAFFDAHENAAHSGDCTKEAHTCSRCLVETALAETREEHG